MYIHKTQESRRSEDVHGMLWTPYARSVYFLCPEGNFQMQKQFLQYEWFPETVLRFMYVGSTLAHLTAFFFFTFKLATIENIEGKQNIGLPRARKLFLILMLLQISLRFPNKLTLPLFLRNWFLTTGHRKIFLRLKIGLCCPQAIYDELFILMVLWNIVLMARV